MTRRGPEPTAPGGTHVGPTQFKRLALIAVWQTVMVTAVLYFDPSPREWISSTFAVAALLVPFIGYIAALYDIPLLARWPRILRVAVLTLLSLLVTVGGYCILFFAVLLARGEL